MKVFFGASTSELDKSYPLYKIICDEVKKSGNELTRDWLDDGRENFVNKLSVDYEEMYDDVLSSILFADVGIIEGTLKGMSTGHQMTIALQRGKPLLFLRQEDADGISSLMIRGAHSDLLTEHTYSDESEVPKLVNDFLNMHKRGKRIRFNLVLSPQEQQYIDWASHIYDKSKTEVIRELIHARMNSDLNYRKEIKRMK